MADQLVEMDIGDGSPQPTQLVEGDTPIVGLSPEVADRRAQKFNLAMGDQSPGLVDLTRKLQDGQEQNLRDTLTRQRQIELRQQQIQTVNELVQSHAGKNPLTPDQLEVFYNLTRDQIEDPNTVIEKVFARKAMTTALQGDTNPTFDQGLQEHPDSTLTKLDVGEGVVARQEGYRKILEDLSAQWQQSNWASKGLNFAQAMVPFASWYNTYDGNSGGILPGSNKSAQYDDINAMPIEQAIATAKARAAEITNNPIAGNPLDAINWIQGLINYSSSDQSIDNLMGGVDVAFGVASGAKALVKGAQTTKAISDITKALARSAEYKPSVVLDAAGHTEEAGKLAAVETITSNLNPPKLNAVDEVAKAAPSLFNLSRYVQGTKDFSTEVQRRILDVVNNKTPELVKAMSFGMRIERFAQTPEVQKAMVEQANALVKLQYPNLVDNINDVRVNWDDVTNTYSARVYVGDENAVAFKTEESARNSARLRGFKDSQVEQYGGGWWVTVDKPIDETGAIMRSLPIELDAQTPRTMMNMLLGRVRSPEDLLSKTSRIDRKIAATGTSELQNVVQKTAERIGQLPKKSRDRLYQFIEADRIHETPVIVNGRVKETQIGRYANNLGELDRRWYETFGRKLSEHEATAYMDFVRLSDLDWTLRNFRVYRDKTRAALEVFNFKFGGRALENIEAKTIDNLKWDGPDTGLMVLDDNPRYFRQSQLKPEYVQRLLDDGYRIHQISPLGEASLKGDSLVKSLVGDDDLTYVLSRKYDVSPLPLQQLRHKPGFHVEYTDGHYVAQPKVTRLTRGSDLEHRYDGDINLFHFTNRAKAAEVAKILDQVRVMLKDGKPISEIDDLITKYLPKSPDDIRGLFAPRNKWDGTVEPPVLSLTEPISARASGSRLGHDLQLRDRYTNYKDSADSPYNLYSGINLDYTGERGALLESLEKLGSEYRPVFKTRQAQLVDAQATMVRAMRNLIDSRYLDDLKIKEAEKFIKEFGHFLHVDPAELKTNPIKYIMNADKYWVQHSVNQQEFQAAKNANIALRQFLGQKSEYNKVLRQVKSTVLDSIYSRFGDKGLDIAEPVALWKITDPVSFMRGTAFHFKLGLFNPVQLMVQGQTFAHTAALAGLGNAMKSLPAVWLMRALKFTDEPAIINKFAKMSETYGWKNDHFKEAYQLMRETGWDRIDGSTAFREDMLDPTVVKTATGKWLDWSTTFFTEGNRLPRMAAMNSAYSEWRAANPLGKLTNEAKRTILDRADTLSLNMTHASNASWQKGLLSVPTQFFAYQARLAEQLLGKRLTGVEKMRVMGMYTALYGLPVAGAAWMGVVPLPEIVRSKLIENSIPYDDNVLTQGLMDGFASVMLQAALGERYNVGERYGPGGLNEFRDWLQGKEDGFSLLTGVSGSTVSDIFKAIAPAASDVAALIGGDSTAVRQFLVEDLMEATKEVSTVNNFTKMMYGLMYGKLITKHEMNISDITKTQSVMQFLTGLSPQEVSDSFIKRDILGEWDQLKKDAGKTAQTLYRRGMRAKTFDDIKHYFDRAFLTMEGAGMDPREKARVWTNSTKNFETFLEQINAEFAKSSPERMQKYLDDQKRGN